jgi:hypothetical protein
MVNFAARLNRKHNQLQGLKIICVVDENKYELGKTVTDEELTLVNIKMEKILLNRIADMLIP